MDGGFSLRDYQKCATYAALQRNLLCVLPTNSGKTVIAAEVVFHTLRAHESKKVVFIAPKRTLALQQARLLLRHIGPLHLLSDERSNQKREDPRWRLAIASGATWVEDPGDLDAVSWRSAFVEAQCIVTTAELFEHALTHGCGVRMDEIALLVLDEAHALRGSSNYRTIMKYFYELAEQRPRVLGLTASPIEKPETTTPSREQVREGLVELQKKLDAQVCTSDSATPLAQYCPHNSAHRPLRQPRHRSARPLRRSGRNASSLANLRRKSKNTRGTRPMRPLARRSEPSWMRSPSHDLRH